MSAQRSRLQRASIGGLNNKQNFRPDSKRHSLAANTNDEASSAAFAKKSKPSHRQSIAKLEESNISVYVRCRSRNDREIKENSGVVVSTLGHLGKEVLLQTGPMSISNKTYTFDRVFGAESDQEMVYDGIAKSVLSEMLQGYNCTIFAYGQTGTGKTYTMSGDIQTNGTISAESGIIPRILMDLFDELEKQTEFSVKVSFIELYNEELRDLLVANDQEERKVRIFEDPKKSILVQGMEEVYIKSVAEGMRVLSNGSYKRQVAATQCNDLSSRSHSVFTITVHMKQIDPISGEEYLKIGKLNLVDLAGSENINRSGAENKRAREAGMINQSLLTLGRVINALVDQSAHVPYRESKLTRLLQDSLGGKTKTCIIATISPAKVSLDETISTLEYANRAKSIKNKPQVNQTMSKKLLIREYVQEIERLRSDLNATRAKNGIYLTEDNWATINAESESRRIQVDEQKLRIQVLEDQIKKYKLDFNDYTRKIQNIQRNLTLKEQDNNTLQVQLSQKTTQWANTLKELSIEKLINEDRENAEARLNRAYKSLSSLTYEIHATNSALITHIENHDTSQKQNSHKLNLSKGLLNSNLDDLEKDTTNFHTETTELNRTLYNSFDVMIEGQRKSVSKKCVSLHNSSSDIFLLIEKSLSQFVELLNSTDGSIDKVEEVKKTIEDKVIFELNALQNESLKLSHDVQSNFNQINSTVKNSFEHINSNIKGVMDTVVSQFTAQANEIIALKQNLSEHQRKYNTLLNEQTQRLIQMKDIERVESEESQNELLNKIKDLVKEHESSKLQRWIKSIDTVYPELAKIEAKHCDFTKKFESFVDDSWVANQNKFVEQLIDQAKAIEDNILQKQGPQVYQQLSTLSQGVKKHNRIVNDTFHKAVNNLDENMVNLDIFSCNLKSLNCENKRFTEDRLRSVQIATQKTMEDASHEFTTFMTDLGKTKQEVIGAYLDNCQNKLSSLNKASSAHVEELRSNISELEYKFEISEPLPKRQKLDHLHITLPAPKTRKEIIASINDSKKIASLSSLSTSLDSDGHECGGFTNDITRSSALPVPIPDRAHFRPLSEDSNNLNIPKNGVPDSEKQIMGNEYEMEDA